MGCPCYEKLMNKNTCFRFTPTNTSPRDGVGAQTHRVNDKSDLQTRAGNGPAGVSLSATATRRGVAQRSISYNDQTSICCLEYYCDQRRYAIRPASPMICVYLYGLDDERHSKGYNRHQLAADTCTALCDQAPVN